MTEEYIPEVVMLADPFLAGWDGAADTELDSADKLTGTAISDLDLPW